MIPVAENPILETEDLNTRIHVALSASPENDECEANHEQLLETWNDENGASKIETDDEEDKDSGGFGAEEYDVIGKTKSLKKSVSLQTEFIEYDLSGGGDQIVA
jgi:hypothetical protein